MKDVIFNSGLIGFLIWALLFAASTAAVAVAIRCGWMLRPRRFEADRTVGTVLEHLRSGDWDGAAAFCGKSPSVAAAVLAGLLPAAAVRTGVQRQELARTLLDRRVREILRLINTLSLCGNIAPMLGLLGTVTGMVDAFLGLGTAMGPEKASVLAISISQALYTTAAGLLIAVPAIALCVLFRNLLEKRVESVVDGLDRVLAALPEPASSAPVSPACGSGTETRRIGRG